MQKEQGIKVPSQTVHFDVTKIRGTLPEEFKPSFVREIISLLQTDDKALKAFCQSSAHICRLCQESVNLKIEGKQVKFDTILQAAEVLGILNEAKAQDLYDQKYFIQDQFFDAVKNQKRHVVNTLKLFIQLDEEDNERMNQYLSEAISNNDQVYFQSLLKIIDEYDLKEGAPDLGVLMDAIKVGNLKMVNYLLQETWINTQLGFMSKSELQNFKNQVQHLTTNPFVLNKVNTDINTYLSKF